ncbi:S41 family peptidase [Pedobacter rhizosphaerae]|uniref:Peptidase family S41 n=1 Tax=Pedobacter rhizosphaerae TaxID=390241 RepID=A0A1H9QCI4_9SPHI|nr:S41 family peptidase [Pedobacter rhizosphaerae]SER57865.1 Peptidase family S41 [Pedobacter rhizosphaerae]
MKNNKLGYRIVLVLLSLSIFISCKKNTATPEETSTTTTTIPTTGTRTELTRDSMFLYAKELYYWNTSLPTYDVFKPRAFSSNEAELYALTQYSTDPTTGKPYEYVSNSTDPKYSFLDYVSTTGKTAALKADVNGTANDYGFSADYQTVNDFRVKYVYANSPASTQGLTRGCRITSVNGRTNLNITSDGIISFLNNAIFGGNPSVSLTFEDLNGNVKSVVVNSAPYTVNPILYTHVYTVGSKKVGYIVFNSFTNNVTTALNNAFNNFSAEGITELIVDLRYNGGGYVSTATQIVNLAAPAAQTGNTMYTTYYNSYLQNLTTAQRKASVLAHQPLLDNSGKLQPFTTGVNGKYATYADLNYSPTAADNVEKFAKSGSLALSRVYFLVSHSTASASELTINSLKPVMDVKIIGERTYGKPVGFFPIRIDDFEMYIPEFETKNQSGVGGYYSGMAVDKEAYGDFNSAWGDTAETLLYYALTYAEKGSFIDPVKKTASLKTTSATVDAKLSTTQINTVQATLDQHRFKGMVMTPKGSF